jgi:hypothetical protein
MAFRDEGSARRRETGPARSSRTRGPEQGESGGVALMVSGPDCARVADMIAALTARVPDDALAFLVAHEIAHWERGPQAFAGGGPSRLRTSIIALETSV